MYFLISKEGRKALLKVAEPQNSLCNGSSDPQKAALCLGDVSVVASALRSEALRLHVGPASCLVWNGTSFWCILTLCGLVCWGVLWSEDIIPGDWYFPSHQNSRPPAGQGWKWKHRSEAVGTVLRFN